MKMAICPGLPRGGTSYLFRALKASGTEEFNIPVLKETNYFTRFTDVDEGAFRSLYPEASPAKYYLDVSPAYLAHPAAIERIVNCAQHHDIRIIISLRQPIEQAYSHYLHDLRVRIGPRQRLNAYYPFFSKDALKKYLKPKAPPIGSLVKGVGRDRIFVMDFHRDLSNNEELQSRLCEFVGIETSSLSAVHAGAGGSMPYYLYGGATGLEIVVDKGIRLLPSKSLLLVNGRSSMIWQDIEENLANSLLSGAASWTRRIDQAQARALYNMVEHDFLEVLSLLGLPADAFPPCRSSRRGWRRLPDGSLGACRAKRASPAF